MLSKITHLGTYYKDSSNDPWVKVNLIVKPDDNFKRALDNICELFRPVSLLKNPTTFDGWVLSEDNSIVKIEQLEKDFDIEQLEKDFDKKLEQLKDEYVTGYKLQDNFWNKLPDKFNSYQWCEYLCVNPLVSGGIQMLQKLKDNPPTTEENSVVWYYNLLRVTDSLERHWH